MALHSMVGSRGNGWVANPHRLWQRRKNAAKGRGDIGEKHLSKYVVI